MTKAGTLREIRKNWQNYALMAPFLILFALFTLIPIIYSVVISFTNFNIFHAHLCRLGQLPAHVLR